MPVRVIAFDVNETLLDLSALDGPFVETLGDASLRAQWFAQMLALSFVGGLTGQYVDFRTAQLAAMEMLAHKQGVELADGAAELVVGTMSRLSAHPEVDGAMRRLRATGMRTVALTNSPQEVAETQLAHSGLRQHFDEVYSADTVRALKPARQPYELVASSSGVQLSEVRLVAAHGWDISGALAAGCQAAFVARPGAVLSPIGPQPDIVGADLDEVVDAIIGRDVG